MPVDAFARGHDWFSLHIIQNITDLFYRTNLGTRLVNNTAIREVTLGDTLLIVILLSRSGILEKFVNFFPLCLCPSYYPTHRGVSMGIFDIHVGPRGN